MWGELCTLVGGLVLTIDDVCLMPPMAAGLTQKSGQKILLMHMNDVYYIYESK